VQFKADPPAGGEQRARRTYLVRRASGDKSNEEVYLMQKFNP